MHTVGGVSRAKINANDVSLQFYNERAEAIRSVSGYTLLMIHKFSEKLQGGSNYRIIWNKSICRVAKNVNCLRLCLGNLTHAELDNSRL